MVEERGVRADNIHPPTMFRRPYAATRALAWLSGWIAAAGRGGATKRTVEKAKYLQSAVGRWRIE